jgi:ATP-dependent protease ClpP protease subunit
MRYGNPERELTGNFIADHWAGRQSLARSYWINGVIIAGVGGALLVALISQVTAWDDVSLQFSAAIGIAAFALGIAIWVWSAVGIWRSAGYHTETGGSGIWAALARIAVVLGGFTTFGQLVQSMPGLIESASIATNNDTLGDPAFISVEQGGINLSGPLTLGTARKFEEALASNPEVKILRLSSTGGRIAEAQMLADLIRRRGLDVETVGECSSACTLALLAGSKRSRSRKWIGFHQPSFPGAAPRERAQMKNELRKIYVEAGLPNSFVEKALTSSPQAMWYPNEMELFEAGVLNHVLPKRITNNFRAIAYHENQKAPVAVDELTQLVSVEASDDTLTRRYQVAESRRNFNVAKAQASVRASVAESLCSQSMVPQFMESGAKYRFIYRDNANVEFMDFTLTRCK